MGCAEHTGHHQSPPHQMQPQQLQAQTQQLVQQPPQQLMRSSPPMGVQLQARGGKLCASSMSMTTAATTVTENIISVSSASASTKVIVEAAKTIPVEGQSDLQHMQVHHQVATSLQEIKELDFSMF
jgi:hypothetical protein